MARGHWCIQGDRYSRKAGQAKIAVMLPPAAACLHMTPVGAQMHISSQQKPGRVQIPAKVTHLQRSLRSQQHHGGAWLPGQPVLRRPCAAASPYAAGSAPQCPAAALAPAQSAGSKLHRMSSQHGSSNVMQQHCRPQPLPKRIDSLQQSCTGRSKHCPLATGAGVIRWCRETASMAYLLHLLLAHAALHCHLHIHQSKVSHERGSLWGEVPAHGCQITPHGFAPSANPRPAGQVPVKHPSSHALHSHIQ